MIEFSQFETDANVGTTTIGTGTGVELGGSTTAFPSHKGCGCCLPCGYCKELNRMCPMYTPTITWTAGAIDNCVDHNTLNMVHRVETTC